MLRNSILRNEKLSLPENWEAVLEFTMLQRPLGVKLARTYICSPCRADTPEGVIRNMKAARVYMFYSYIYFQGVPRAPHAYLPIMLNDNFEDEREIALHFGTRLLMDCDLMLVCGNRLSEGMYSEITAAIKNSIPVQVFTEASLTFSAFVWRSMATIMNIRIMKVAADTSRSQWVLMSWLHTGGTIKYDLQFQKADLSENCASRRCRRLHGRRLQDP